MFSVDVNDTNCVEKLKNKLALLIGNQKLVILCIGCDRVAGDSLGPMIGTRLIESLDKDVIVYGMIDNNINAKNLLLVKNMIKELHYDRILLVIDAALGRTAEVGTIQIYSHGLYPGSATNKNLPCVGDISIVGIVNEKINAFGLSMLYTARQQTVNSMAQAISDSITQAIA